MGKAMKIYTSGRAQHEDFIDYIYIGMFFFCKAYVLLPTSLRLLHTCTLAPESRERLEPGVPLRSVYIV